MDWLAYWGDDPQQATQELRQKLETLKSSIKSGL